jgi:hypothetical protein
MEYLRGLAAAVKPIHPGVGAAEERQECTTRERCEHRAAGGSAVAAGLRPGQAKEVWHGSRRSTPQPLERRRAEASSSANCSHFCSHLANLRPSNPVTARLLKPTTASLLSSRSMVRIHQGAFLKPVAAQAFSGLASPVALCSPLHGRACSSRFGLTLWLNPSGCLGDGTPAQRRRHRLARGGGALAQAQNQRHR